MRLNDFIKLIIAVGVCELAGVVGSIFTVSSISTWYAGLIKPVLNPPSWVFGPAWITLYFLMGVAAFLIWSSYAKATDGQRRRTIKIALGIFGVQLFLNAIWSIIFFGLKNPGWAFVDITLLWLAIVGTIIVFSKVSRPAMLLLLPYILWVSFAGYLNYSIWTLNQEETVACTMDAKLCSDGSYVGRVPPDCEFALCPGEAEWLAIKQAIANCEVESVWQAHDRRVGAKLKSGEEFAAFEPELDDIIDLAIAAEPECGKILMGTE